MVAGEIPAQGSFQVGCCEQRPAWLAFRNTDHPLWGLIIGGKAVTTAEQGMVDDLLADTTDLTERETEFLTTLSDDGRKWDLSSRQANWLGGIYRRVYPAFGDCGDET